LFHSLPVCHHLSSSPSYFFCKFRFSQLCVEDHKGLPPMRAAESHNAPNLPVVPIQVEIFLSLEYDESQVPGGTEQIKFLAASAHHLVFQTGLHTGHTKEYSTGLYHTESHILMELCSKHFASDMIRGR
jgi:hypothetical protein